MKGLITVFAITIFLFGFAPPVFAVSPEVTEYTTNTLQIITLISAAAAVFFLVKAGYLYIVSTGKPETLETAKNTIRNTFIGLILILSANIVVSVFRHSLNPTDITGTGSPIEVIAIEAVEPSTGLVQIIIDTLVGVIQNLVESASQPIFNGILGYLTTTPTLLDNTVIRNFWLVSLGIVDALFVLIVALLGLQVMSASTFGFEEVEVRQLLPRLGLAFLGANISLFLADYIIITCNVLVKAILDATGGLTHAWIVNAITPEALLTGGIPLITLVFLLLFLILSIVLLLMYISRLIMISLGAVLSPFIFLLWLIPKFSDFATLAVKSYVVTVFVVFIHVVMIQLAGSFLALPDHENNSLIAVAVAIGLLFSLLKAPSLMMQMVFYSSGSGTLKKLGSQIINVMSTSNSSSSPYNTVPNPAAKVPKKVINI